MGDYIMPYFTAQMHVRVDEDRELIRKIDELLLIFPDRFRTQSDVIRAAVNYMHRYETSYLDKRNHEARKWQT